MKPGLLHNPIRSYAWGSRTALADLLGATSPSPVPQAELWMGAHPLAPSIVEQGDERISLPTLIAAWPSAALGVDVVSRMGDTLPFLLKVLAVARPLSLQAHPDDTQSRIGFDAEEEAAIPRDAPTRRYRDPNAKPELLCALTPFRARCGFRPTAEAAALLGSLDVLPGLRAALEHGSFQSAFAQLLTTDSSTRAARVASVIEACAEHLAANGPFTEDCRTALALATEYPGDIGIVAALLLNPVELAPGEAIFLGPRQLHCYLEGTAIEIMGSSDNALRCGLTHKHVDVPELLHILDFTPRPPEVQLAKAYDAVEQVYEAPTECFSLSRLEIGAATASRYTSHPLVSAEILLCTEGSATLGARGVPPIRLARGAAAFIPARTGRYWLEGEGTVFRASAGV